MGSLQFGGDEFAIFIEKCTAGIAEKLVAELRDTMTRKAGNGPLDPDKAIVSRGYALYNPKTDASCEDIFNRADRDMYEDKKRFYEINPHLRQRG